MQVDNTDFTDVWHCKAKKSQQLKQTKEVEEKLNVKSVAHYLHELSVQTMHQNSA